MVLRDWRYIVRTQPAHEIRKNIGVRRQILCYMYDTDAKMYARYHWKHFMYLLLGPLGLTIVKPQERVLKQT